MALQLRTPPDVAETDRSPVARFIQTTEHDDIVILLYNLATIDAGPKRPVFRLAYVALPGRRSDVPVSRPLPIRVHPPEAANPDRLDSSIPDANIALPRTSFM